MAYANSGLRMDHDTMRQQRTPRPHGEDAATRTAAASGGAQGLYRPP
jgi:hypothetical protein